MDKRPCCLQPSNKPDQTDDVLNDRLVPPAATTVVLLRRFFPDSPQTEDTTSSERPLVFVMSGYNTPWLMASGLPSSQTTEQEQHSNWACWLTCKSMQIEKKKIEKKRANKDRKCIFQSGLTPTVIWHRMNTHVNQTKHSATADTQPGPRRSAPRSQR